MRVAYFYAPVYMRKDYPEQRILAAKSIASVRRAMPDVEIVHLTDETLPALDGVDSVLRVPRCTTLEMHNRADCQSLLTGEVLILDTDTIVSSDVRGVWKDDFDVAVAEKGEAGLYNQGVVFSRSQEFWRAVGERARERGVYDENGFTDVLDSGSFKVKLLPNIYNFAPPPEMQIFHFKGPRKKTMLSFYA